MKRKTFKEMATLLSGEWQKVPHPEGEQKMRLRCGPIVEDVSVSGRTVTAVGKRYRRWIGQPLHKLTQRIQDEATMRFPMEITDA